MFGASRLSLFAANPVAASASGTTYWAGGYDNGTLDSLQRTNTIRKYILSSETASTLSGTLQGSYDGVGGFGNSTYGWSAGGGVTDSSGTPVSNVSKTAFSDDTVSTSTAMNSSRRNGRGTSSSTDGFIFCVMTSSSAVSNNMNTVAYSDNAWASNTNFVGFSTARRDVGIHCNSTLAVLQGGYSGTSFYSDVRTYTFSSGAMAAGGYSITTARAAHSTTGNQSKYVSISGAKVGSVLVGIVQSYLFSDGTLTAGTDVARYFRMGDAAGDNNVGIFVGGSSFGGTSGTNASNCQVKYTYSTDATSTPGAVYGNSTMDGPGAFHSTQIS